MLAPLSLVSLALLFSVTSGMLLTANPHQGGSIPAGECNGFWNVLTRDLENGNGEGASNIPSAVEGEMVLKAKGRQIVGGLLSQGTTLGGFEGKMVLKAKGRQFVRGLLSEEIDVGDFVAFNADYHQPKHHPPKNN